MKRRKVKLSPELCELLLDAEFSSFTVLGLRDAFEARYGLGECDSSSELRNWLYRRILPLCQKGYLEKVDQEAGEPCVYQVCEQFKDEYLPGGIQVEKPTPLALDRHDTPPLSVLRAKLNQYQVDMLACAGECKEYQQLVEEFPQLKEHIEPMYRNARERSSELMGQLRAINNILQRSNLPQ